jgi:acyl-CoA thioester hydrolase
MTDKLLYSLPLAARWGDMDSFNHVNNAAFATYLEEARMQWFTSLGPGWIDERVMPILAAQTINYRIPIEWPAPMVVELRTGRVGRTSLTLAFRIVSTGSPVRHHADGSHVLVWVDRASGRSVPLPELVRSAAA